VICIAIAILSTQLSTMSTRYYHNKYSYSPISASRRRRLHLRFRHSGTSSQIRLLLLSFICILIICVSAISIAWSVTPTVDNTSTVIKDSLVQHHAPYTTYSQMSPLIAQALTASEDKRFYIHHGIDGIAIVRAIWDDLHMNGVLEGGSTITDQLAKNVYLQGSDASVQHKLTDQVLAVKIEQHYTKSQIIEYYVNIAYFGEGAYGIGAAAQHYFHTSPAHLDLAQSALLIGILQAPSVQDPWCHADIARARQQVVLARMITTGQITAVQRTKAEQEQFPFWQSGVTRPANIVCG